MLGSTGSIGTQTLEVLARCTDAVRLHGLAVSGSRPETAAQQVLAHAPARVAIADEDAADQVAAAIRAALAPEARDMPSLDVGEDAVVDLAGALGAGDVVVNAVTGSVGLRPTLAALASGARLALANKESLIAGGELVTGAAAEGQILPVDSEHTAIAQALAGVRPEHVDRLVVTASGGPFRGRSRAELGEVTTLVNNAGAARAVSLHDTTADIWRRDNALNLEAPFLCFRAFEEALKLTQGSVVNITSVNGMAVFGHPAYSAAKAGLIHLTRLIAVEYGKFGIRCNAVAPGTVRTQAWEARAAVNPQVFAEAKHWYPLQRIVRPEDVANAVAFLAGPQAFAISGVCLPVDCGLTAGQAPLARTFSQSEHY